MPCQARAAQCSPHLPHVLLNDTWWQTETGWPICANLLNLKDFGSISIVKNQILVNAAKAPNTTMLGKGGFAYIDFTVVQYLYFC